MQDRLKLPALPTVIHNSFVAPRALPKPALRSLLVAEGFAPTEHLVLFLGKLFRQHALEEVIESMVDWPADTGLVLVGYGDAEYVDDLLRLAESKGLAERVCHLGSTPPGTERVLSLMREASIGLVLKRYKGGILNDVYYTPTKLFEYAAAGLPVICSDQESLRFVQREGWGICVDIDHPSSIAQAVNDILEDATVRDQMAETARRRFATDYSMEREMAPLLSQLAEWHPSKGNGIRSA
jgi:glycosyltransferase involved in cell wall biosynthesis